MLHIKIFTFLLCIHVHGIATISVEDVQTIFKYNLCVQGSLASLSSLEEHEIKEKVFESPAGQITVFNLIAANNEDKYEKAALSELHELVQFNEIRYFFELFKEEGLAHNKQFTVSLVLGDENYKITASSLKKAKQKLASLALKQTEYQHGPTHIRENENVPLTPTVVLNNVAMKIAMPIKYFLITETGERDITHSYAALDERPKKSYLQKLNESIYNPDNRSLRIPTEDAQLKGPFTVRVTFGNENLIGIGHTIQSARHDAAAKAIDILKTQALEKTSPCLREGSEKDCKKAKDGLKSPISLVHEAAQQRNMDAIFEIVDEFGPSHKKTFITRCTLGHVVEEAQGRSKKDSKRAVAEKILRRLDELPKVSDEALITQSFKPKNSKKKKNKMIKTNVEKIGMVVNDLYESIVGGLGSKEKENKPDSSNDDVHSPKKMKKIATSEKKSPTDDILDLSNSLNFEIDFKDLQKKSVFYSILSLDVKPPHMCLGQDLTQTNARDKAAQAALDLLSNFGFSRGFKKVVVPTEDVDEVGLEDKNIYVQSENDLFKDE